jgi:hypothetical protein
MSLFSVMVPTDPVAWLLPAFILLAFASFLFQVLRRRRGSGRLEGIAAPYLGRAWLLGSVAVAAFLIMVYLGRLSQGVSADLEADMQISDGQTLEAFINDLTASPARVGVSPKTRRVYRFEHIPSTLTFLRFNPTEAVGARISIYSVAIVSEGRVIRRYGPDQLRAWKMSNLVEAPGEAGSLNLVSTSNDPILATSLSLATSNRPAWIRGVASLFQRPHFYSLFFMGSFFLFLLCGVSRIEGALDAALAAAVAAAAWPIALLAARIPVPPTPVSSAVGNVGYTGYPKLHEYLASYALLAVCFGLAWLASRYLRPTSPPADAAIRTRLKRVPAWAPALVPAAVFLGLIAYYLPNLRPALDQLSQANFQPVDWDSANAVLWGYLVGQHYLPFRDFWYPYSGFYSGLLAFPVGALIACLQEFLTLLFLYLGLRRCLRTRGPAVLLFLLFLLPVLLGEFAGWYRYLLGIDLVLFYVAAARDRGLDWRKHVPFALLAGFVFFFEPVQVAYAAAGMSVHTALCCRPQPGGKLNLRTILRQASRLIRQRAVCVGVPLLAGALPVVVFLAASGMLPGFIHFHASLGSASLYGALPADVAGWTLPAFHFETIFVIFFVALTLALRAWFRDSQSVDFAAAAALVVGLAGFLAMQKQILRPHNMDVVQVYPYAGVLLCGVSAWPRRTKAQAAVAALFVGSVAGLAVCQGTLRSLYESVKQAPASLAGDLVLLSRMGPEVRSADAGLYDPASFAAFGPENEVVRTLKGEFGWSRGQPVYVLGDDLVFYVLLRQIPPYVANSYNCSPLSEQQRVLEWLRERRPRFVLWNPSKDSFDLVPHVVRLPLIYQYVVENYRPLKVVEPYQILVTKAERPGSDPQYWVQQLGASLDLGSIPRAAQASEYRDCPADPSAACQSVLFVHFSARKWPGQGLAIIDGPDGSFRVQFDVVPGSHTYIVDLDRLWFRSLIGLRPRVRVPVFGAEARVETRLRKNGVLY